MGRPAPPDAVAALSPFRFAAPLSPAMAAAREGRRLDPDAVVAACRAMLAGGTPVLIEGIGGAMVPLDAGCTVLDVMAALALPVLLVTGSGLGALSHCLTAQAALGTRGLAPALVVVNETADSSVLLADTVATLTSFCRSLAVLGRDPPDNAFDALLARLAPTLRGSETAP